MSQYPSVIDLAAIDGINGFRINGEAASDISGYSVASAGDVNGDGFADLIVGAIGADPNGAYSGASYVVFGKAPGFDADIDLSSLDGINGFKVSGVALLDRAGFSLASAGDVNGDGFADLIVGAHGADSNGDNSGAAYVVFGKASGFGAELELSGLDGSNGFKLSGVAAYDYAGRSVASAGDLNGDGFDDVIVGAWGASPNDPHSGASYVVFGQASGFAANIDLSSLNGTNGFRISGAAANDRSGDPVASAGDVNGDGHLDLIIGAQRADPNGSDSGASYVVFGQASGFAANIDLTSLDGSNGFSINGVAADNYSGASVASAGDINGDGFADLIVGSPGADPNGLDTGASYVVFGAASGFAANLELSSLDGTNGFQLSGRALERFVGDTVASAGDVNGDGFDDLILLSKQGLGPASDHLGGAYVVFGKASGFNAVVNLSDLDGTNGFEIIGPTDNGGFLACAGAGDVNADGLADLIVGLPGIDTHGAASGASYVLFGRLPDASVNRVGSVIAQTLVGGNLNDTLSGLGGNDRLLANGGDDVLNGGAGDDTVNGGGGTDTASYAGAASGVTVSLAVPGPQATGGDGTDTLISIENLTGSDYADTLTGDTGANVLNGGAGNDVLNGGGGTDTASYAGAGAGVKVTLNRAIGQDTGGAGVDTLHSIENLLGSDHADTLTGNAGANVLGGGAGNDMLRGAAGNDTLDGGAGSDTASYGGAVSGVSVEAGLVGPQDTLGAGIDTLVSIENLIGSAFNDSLTVGPSSGTLNGGAGDDTLLGGAGNDTLIGGVGDDKLYGAGGVDTLIGGAGNDALTVLAGSGTLLGGAGADVLTGSLRADVLNGGAGVDTLTGGGGNDAFDFAALSDSKAKTPDLITDFSSGDQIDLHLIDADTGAGGDQAFHLGATLGHTGDIVVTYDAGHNRTGVALYVDANKKADAVIWLTGDHHDLTGADFVL